MRNPKYILNLHTQTSSSQAHTHTIYWRYQPWSFEIDEVTADVLIRTGMSPPTFGRHTMTSNPVFYPRWAGGDHPAYHVATGWYSLVTGISILTNQTRYNDGTNQTRSLIVVLCGYWWGQLGWDQLALDRIYEINFMKTKYMFKNSQKNWQHTSMLYMQHQKFAASNSTYI